MILVTNTQLLPTVSLQPVADGTFNLPHSVALVEDWNLLCVADRENERIQVSPIV